jgi:hypothetical protein
MKIELKNIKVQERLSEETTCFSATIYVDGKKAGEVLNRGCGGCNDYYWDNPAIGKAVDAFCESLPLQYNFEKTDQYIDSLLEPFLNKKEQNRVRKQMERLCKKETMFRLKGTPRGEWKTVKAPFGQKVKDFLINKYGDNIECIANEDIEKSIEYC